MSELVDEYLDNIQEAIPLVAFSAASLLMTAFNLYKNHLTRATRRCKDLPPREKSICMLNSKILAKNVQLQSLKSNFSKCEKSKSSDECKLKFAKKMKELANEIKFLVGRLKELRTQKY
jgi:hypothetical protein